MDEEGTDDGRDTRPLDRKLLGWLFVGLTAAQLVFILRAMGVESYAVRALVRRTVAHLRPRDVSAEARAGIAEAERYLQRAALR